MLYAMRVQKKTKLLPIEGLQGTIIIYSVFKNKKMVFGNGVKNIQAAAYNGARMVGKSCDS